MSKPAKAWTKRVLPGIGLLLGVVVILLALGVLGPDQGTQISERGDGDQTKQAAQGSQPQRDESGSHAIDSGKKRSLIHGTQGERAAGAEQNQIVVVGRCVAAEDAQPLADCEIYLFDPPRDNQDRPGRILQTAWIEVQRWEIEFYDHSLGYVGPKDWQRPVELDRFFLSQPALDELRAKGKVYQRKPDAVTDEEGRFRLEFTPGAWAGSSFRLFTSSPHRLPREFQGKVLAVGEVTDLGTMTLFRGLRVGGQVVSSDGTPKAGATVRIHGLPNDLLAGEPPPIQVVCGVDGGFAFAYPIPDGRWRLTVNGEGIATHAEWIFVQGSAIDRKIVIQDRPTISGMLHLPSGQPAVAIKLLAISSDNEIQGHGQSASDGRFRILATAETLPPVRLVTKESSMELLDSPAAIRWGSTGLEVEVRKTDPLDILLEDQSTGAAISGQFLILGFAPWGGGGFSAEDTYANVKRGRFRVRHVPRSLSHGIARKH